MLDDAPTQPAYSTGEPPATLPVRQFGSIRLIRQIGKGGMGEVWLGRHELLGRDVAVKILLTAVLDRSDPAFTDFIRGAKVAASRVHPSLNKVLHADVADGVPYLVLEHLDGPNLHELMARSGRLDLATVRAVLEAVGEAVAELHQHDLVHRDLKPSNVMLTSDGRVVVTDFGLACARPVSALRINSGVVSGTPNYMAPEMFDGVVSARTDVYAIGMMAYELLCGHPAFTGTFDELQRQHQTVAINVEPLGAAGVPDGVIDVVVRATSKDILFRPKTARHVLEAFRAAFDAAGIQPAPREALARILKGLASSSTDQTKTPPARSGSAAETVAQFAARKRQSRNAMPPNAKTTEPTRQIDPAYAQRRRAERRRARIAFWGVSVIGACLAVAAVAIVNKNAGRWQQWVDDHLVHARVIMIPGPGGSATFSKATPWWGTTLIVAPMFCFPFLAVVISFLLYRALRGDVLPEDTENTRCGWCQHELRGISTPVCGECGHRIGDQGPDEQGLYPLARRGPRRVIAWTLLPLVFFIVTFVTAIVIGLLVRLAYHPSSGVSVGGPIVMLMAMFPALAFTLFLYEALLQLDVSHSGRAWCRVCKGELRDLVEPICPTCGTAI